MKNEGKKKSIYNLYLQLPRVRKIHVQNSIDNT